jgi:hypothetical protein
MMTSECSIGSRAGQHTGNVLTIRQQGANGPMTILYYSCLFTIRSVSANKSRYVIQISEILCTCGGILLLPDFPLCRIPVSGSEIVRGSSGARTIQTQPKELKSLSSQNFSASSQFILLSSRLRRLAQRLFLSFHQLSTQNQRSPLREKASQCRKRSLQF